MKTRTKAERSKLSEIGVREEVRKYGIYFLFGENEEKAKPIAYIGETDDSFDRLKNHNRGKEFWNYAVVISSKTNSFTKSYVKYLEYLCINTANQIRRYYTDNQATPGKTYITESMEADLLDNYETIKILLSTLGFPIFEEMRKPFEKKKDLLYCKGKVATAEGNMIDDGFVVFKGAFANKEETKSINPWIVGLRKKLIESKVLVEEGDKLVFKEDYLFSSPNAAAATVIARSANGWNEWKNRNGKTIDELYRAQVDEIS